MSDAAAIIDKEYWGNRLEVNHELVLKQHADDGFVTGWLQKLSPRARGAFARSLDLDVEAPVKEVRRAMLDRQPDLLALMLVEAATAGKRAYAITQVARAKLPTADVAASLISEDKYDRLALMWLLYERDPKNLELVFHLDRVQRKGFARMILGRMPEGSETSASDFFDVANIQAVLDRYEREKRTLRQSHCAAVLYDGGNYQLFIKRDLKSSFVAHGPENTFGWEREWIVLEFEPDLRRVHICSESPDVPLILANRLASSFFGEDVTYENESLVSASDRVLAFVESLLNEPEKLPLVEVVVSNSPLEGAVQLRLNDPDNRSIAPAVNHLVAVLGVNPLRDIPDIESIKVHRFKKRVKVVFEQVPDGDDLVVRYSDQPLTGKERREFESAMEHDYGLTVLSTEKRYAL